MRPSALSETPEEQLQAVVLHAPSAPPLDPKVPSQTGGPQLVSASAAATSAYCVLMARQPLRTPCRRPRM